MLPSFRDCHHCRKRYTNVLKSRRWSDPSPITPIRYRLLPMLWLMVMPNQHNPPPEWVRTARRLISTFFYDFVSKTSKKNQRNHNRWMKNDLKFKLTQIVFLFSLFSSSLHHHRRNTYWMLFAMYPEHFWCDIVHSFDMGRWNCWRHLRLCHRFDMLLCGEYDANAASESYFLLKSQRR